MQLVVASILISLSSVHASPMGPKMVRAEYPSASTPQVRRLAETTQDSCVDDAKWVDEDGDGCAVYATHIQNNEISQSEACNYSNGAAKMHCRATCGLCEQQSESISATLNKQVDSFTASINNVVTALTSSGSVRGDPNPTVRQEQTKHPDAEALLKSSDAEKTCVDDPDWVDADGDNCAVYADHIAQGSLSQDEACMYGNGDARDHCRATCGTCIYDKAQSNSAAEEHSAAPIPAPYRAPVSPKMVPAAVASPPSPALTQEACVDDLEWTDPDGDSCAVYADKIQAGEFLLEEACSYAEEAAKKYCPLTCKTCAPKVEISKAVPTVAKKEAPKVEISKVVPTVAKKEAPEVEISKVVPTVAKKEACIDDPDWVDQDGDGCLAYATAIKVGSITKEEACAFSGGKAKQNCRATCDMCPLTQHVPVHQNILAPTPKKPVGPKMTRAGKDPHGTRGFSMTDHWADEDFKSKDPNASLVKKGACIDDPDWADQDGDDCAAYAKAIKEGEMSQSEACGYANGNAKKHCLVTCNACPRVHSKEQNLLHHRSSASDEADQFI